MTKDLEPKIDAGLLDDLRYSDEYLKKEAPLIMPGEKNAMEKQKQL
jgi:hypothetical protein